MRQRKCHPRKELSLHWIVTRHVFKTVHIYVYQTEDLPNESNHDANTTKLKFYRDATLNLETIISHVIKSENCMVVFHVFQWVRNTDVFLSFLLITRTAGLWKKVGAGRKNPRKCCTVASQITFKGEYTTDFGQTGKASARARRLPARQKFAKGCLATAKESQQTLKRRSEIMAGPCNYLLLAKASRISIMPIHNVTYRSINKWGQRRT